MRSIYRAAIHAGNLNTWIAAVEVIGLVDLLSSDDYLTVFAPSDTAFQNLTRNEVNELLGSLESLVCTVGNHIVPGRIPVSELRSLSSLHSFIKNELFIETAGGLYISGACIIEPEIECRNGLIHTIDSVLLARTHRKTRIGGKALQSLERSKDRKPVDSFESLNP